MQFLNKIPSYVYLVVSIALITTAIVILFLGKFIFAIISLITGIISLVVWTFFGLFDDP
tara:strand:- start:510 stop:686 length:177 start_codon:yes stop_codon:yes gene_type:complete